MQDADRLDDVIRDALGLPPGAELRGIAYETTPEWDSVGHLQLMAAIEAAFGLSIKVDDVARMSDYERLREILRERYGARC
jgi:acyl carrier protein